MPRYFFHCADGLREPDTEGTELANDDLARQMAVSFAGEVLKERPELVWSRGMWRVEVTNEDNALLFTLITLAIDAPKPEPKGVGGQLAP